MPQEFRMGDVVQLRKAHPCGSLEWDIVRLGADIGLRCRTCGRRVLLARSELEKRLRTFVSRGQAADPAQERLVFREREPGP